MEEEDQTPQNPSPQTLDPATQKKHDAMIARLSDLHKSRIDTKSQAASSSPSFESSKSFLSQFSDSKRRIESNLDRIRQKSDPDSRSRVKFELDSVTNSIAELEKLVAENSYYLPAYDVRLSLKAVADLKESLEILSSEVLPKKKFAFKNKAAKKDSEILVTNCEIGKNLGKKPEVGEKEVENLGKTPEIEWNCLNVVEKMGVTVRDSPGFRDKKGEFLVKNLKGLEFGDFTLSDLNSCEIRLIGSLRVLFVHRLKNCRVFVGPVSGSIHIEEVEGCLFMVASHQIRIHHATKTDFYLRVRSRPIIEDSNGVRFAPYSLSYDGIEEDLRKMSLEEETGNWANVDDFRWLRAVQSPNWSVLPENERLESVCISDSETRLEGS